ncbi:hypothetical protein DF3PB_1210002 [uncultured Defluviicoccus sp.]|uniref:Uncharacterized protein n=1 Tax=metagenome TaxID=256318 RepID=A0A380T9K8_9ZZZZ|nr:hypothetical protein DF3PB_1210002 [uncultured Defluviicoccus sp.]
MQAPISDANLKPKNVRERDKSDVSERHKGHSNEFVC